MSNPEPSYLFPHPVSYELPNPELTGFDPMLSGVPTVISGYNEVACDLQNGIFPAGKQFDPKKIDFSALTLPNVNKGAKKKKNQTTSNNNNSVPAAIPNFL